MKVIVSGALGRMGREVTRLVQENEYMELVASIDHVGGAGIYETCEAFNGEADVLIDFSNHSTAPALMAYCVEKKLPVVMATTGHTPEELACINAAAEKIPVFHSANMSVGVALLARLVKQAAAIFGGCDVEIIEKHHNRKVDAPSGTALLLADAVKEKRTDAVYTYGRSGICKREPNELGIHSLRMGSVVGEHEVIFSTDTQTISLKHEAHDRSLFAEGALAAASFLVGQPAGLYHMEDLLG